MSETLIPIGIDLLMFLGLLVLAFIVNHAAKRFVLKIVEQFASKTASEWDDILVKRKFFRRLSHIAPAIVIYLMVDLAFTNETIIFIIRRVIEIYMLFMVVLTVDAFIGSVVDIYGKYDESHNIPVRSISQVIKIVIYTLIGVVIISLIIGKSPAFLIGGLGAMTAVLILIFKDPILGFAAGIQLSVNNMVKVGDWIEMPKYGADGDVTDISLTTVKVQNWDKTITTIPTFALVSEGVKNWRGMSESGGRRIKRAINIDMTSVKFCDEKMLEKFRKYRYISDYIKLKKKELADYNQQKQIDDSELINGRRLTNIGTFRAYLISYLKDNPKISKDLTFLIRQLDPGPNGLPIEIYIFSKDQVWENYEQIQADIFDHVLAAMRGFELRVFQNPTGTDFKNLC